MQPFAGQTRLGAPFGLTRLTDSLANCTGCTADFINIHWYSNKVAGAEYFKSFVDEATAVARGKPIWITEFGLNNENPYAAAELQRVLQEVLPWLDQQVDVELYGVFYGCAGHFVACGGSGLSGAGLGVVYNNFTGGMGESLF